MSDLPLVQYVTYVNLVRNIFAFTILWIMQLKFVLLLRYVMLEGSMQMIRTKLNLIIRPMIPCGPIPTSSENHPNSG